MTTPGAAADAESASCQGCGFSFGPEDLIHCEHAAGAGATGAGGTGVGTDAPARAEAWLCPACYGHEKNAARARHQAPPNQVDEDGP